MKPILIFISVLFLFFEHYSFSQTATFLAPADNKPITFEIKNPEKQFWEQPLFTGLVGTLVGGLIGFLSSWGLSLINQKRTTIKDLKEARAELASLLTKLRMSALALYHNNFYYNFYRLELATASLTVDQTVYKTKSRDDFFEKCHTEKKIFDDLVADSTKYISKFFYYLNQNDIKECTALLVKITQVNFNHFHYMNSKEEIAKKIHIDEYWKLGQSENIDATLVKPNIIDSFLVPVSSILRNCIRKLEGQPLIERAGQALADSTLNKATST